jgi:hypothetical protein
MTESAVPPQIAPEVAAQIAALALEPSRPLVITDADEVLFYFVRGFAAYLVSRGFWLDLASFQLFGNIKYAGRDDLATVEEASELLATFFAERTERIEPVAGAAEVLARLSAEAQIIVLSNLPTGSRPARERALQKAGMPYPLVVNSGVKGPAVRCLADRAGAAEVFFLDDIPRNILSVSLAAPAVTAIHFVADPHLATLVGPAEGCHHRLDDWPAVEALITSRLAEGRASRRS